jgi:hypothetical protein
VPLAQYLLEIIVDLKVSWENPEIEGVFYEKTLLILYSGMPPDIHFYLRRNL